MAENARYIHGTDTAEQERLAALNGLTNPAFLEWLAIEEGDRVLEVGSGLGILAREAYLELRPDCLVGIERSAAQLDRAPHAEGRLQFAAADALEMPFRSGTFDVVYCRYVMEHVADPLRLAQEMRRVLRPGGRAYAQENDITAVKWDPDCPQFDLVWNRFIELQQKIGGDPLVGRKLYRLFKSAGFRAIELTIQPELHHAGQVTFMQWVTNIIANIEGAAAGLTKHGFATAQEIARGTDELRGFANRPDATAIFYWNRATGVR